MNTQSYAINVTETDPKTLRDEDFQSLNEVTQDMWADGIWEFVQCEECWHMHSKKDIFWHLKSESYSLTVRKLMGDFEVDNIHCQVCSWKTKFVYGRGNTDVIKNRLTETQKAFLVIGRNEKDQIVWFEDAYIDTLTGIFNREFETHYRLIWVPEICNRISQALWYNPKELLVLSNIWLLDRYRSFQNIFQILSRFSQTMWKDYDSVAGFTEIDEWNSLHKISSSLGGISLGIRQDPNIWSKITNIWRNYKSDLIVYHGVAAIYKKHFSWSARSLVRLMRDRSESVFAV